MLDELRKRLWEAKYLNPVWPKDLLEVVKEDGYKSINFKQIDGGIEVELSFIDDGDLVYAYYLFDKDDMLQDAYLLENGHKSSLFSREELILNIMTEISTIKSTTKPITA